MMKRNIVFDYPLTVKDMMHLLYESIDQSNYEIMDVDQAKQVILQLSRQSLTVSEIQFYGMVRLIKGIMNNPQNRIRKRIYTRLTSRIPELIPEDELTREVIYNNTIISLEEYKVICERIQYVSRLRFGRERQSKESRYESEPVPVPEALESETLDKLVWMLEGTFNPVTFCIWKADLASDICLELIGRFFDFSTMKNCRIHCVVNSLRLNPSNFDKCPLLKDLHLKVCRIESSQRSTEPTSMFSQILELSIRKHTIELLTKRLKSCIDKNSLMIHNEDQVSTHLMRMLRLILRQDDVKKPEVHQICRIISKNSSETANRELAEKILKILRDYHADKFYPTDKKTLS